MVLTTTSLATRPLSSAPPASHDPKPSGSIAGAMTADTRPKALSATGVSANVPCPPTGMAVSSQMTSVVTRISDDACCKKPRVRCHM